MGTWGSCLLVLHALASAQVTAVFLVANNNSIHKQAQFHNSEYKVTRAILYFKQMLSGAVTTEPDEHCLATEFYGILFLVDRRVKYFTPNFIIPLVKGHFS